MDHDRTGGATRDVTFTIATDGVVDHDMFRTWDFVMLRRFSSHSLPSVLRRSLSVRARWNVSSGPFWLWISSVEDLSQDVRIPFVRDIFHCEEGVVMLSVEPV